MQCCHCSVSGKEKERCDRLTQGLYNVPSKRERKRERENCAVTNVHAHAHTITTHAVYAHTAHTQKSLKVYDITQSRHSYIANEWIGSLTSNDTEAPAPQWSFPR